MSEIYPASEALTCLVLVHSWHCASSHSPGGKKRDHFTLCNSHSADAEMLQIRVCFNRTNCQISNFPSSVQDGVSKIRLQMSHTCIRHTLQHPLPLFCCDVYGSRLFWFSGRETCAYSVSALDLGSLHLSKYVTLIELYESLELWPTLNHLFASTRLQLPTPTVR